MDYSSQVTSRLPRTFAALAAGQVHPVHVRIIEDEIRVLTDADAANADAVLAEAAPGMTFGQLRSAAHKLVLLLDPEAARKRKEAARGEAHVRPFRETSGNAGMVARELPCDEVLASWQHVEQRALDLRAAGMPGTLQELRVLAYLDLLQERDSRDLAADPPPDGEPADSPRGPHPVTARAAPNPTADQTAPGLTADRRDPGENGGPGGPGHSPGGRGPGGPGPGAAPGPGPASGPSLAALVTFTIPLPHGNAAPRPPGRPTGSARWTPTTPATWPPPRPATPAPAGASPWSTPTAPPPPTAACPAGTRRRAPDPPAGRPPC